MEDEGVLQGPGSRADREIPEKRYQKHSKQDIEDGFAHVFNGYGAGVKVYSEISYIFIDITCV